MPASHFKRELSLRVVSLLLHPTNTDKRRMGQVARRATLEVAIEGLSFDCQGPVLEKHGRKQFGTELFCHGART
jgi:hypothetical protein